MSGEKNAPVLKTGITGQQGIQWTQGSGRAFNFFIILLLYTVHSKAELHTSKPIAFNGLRRV